VLNDISKYTAYLTTPSDDQNILGRMVGCVTIVRNLTRILKIMRNFNLRYVKRPSQTRLDIQTHSMILHLLSVDGRAQDEIFSSRIKGDQLDVT